MRRRVARILIFFLMVASMAAPRESRALSPDTKAVLITAGYGILGGTVLGLVSYPLTNDVKSIFVGSSMGLYFGLVAGIYYIHHREDEQNPLRSNWLESPRDPKRELALIPPVEAPRVSLAAGAHFAYPIKSF